MESNEIEKLKIFKEKHRMGTTFNVDQTIIDMKSHLGKMETRFNDMVKDRKTLEQAIQEVLEFESICEQKITQIIEELETTQ